LIAIGILSVINGTVTTSVKIYEDLITGKEIILSRKFTDIQNRFGERPLSGVLYGFILTFIFFVLCTLIGVFFSNLGGYQGFDTQTAGIFSFNDIVSN
jgi:ABC-type glycerol-3-phosphate transport system permease component